MPLLRAFARGLGDSASIGAGYLPIAVSFGLTALEAGLSPLAAVLASLVVFAGASQFVLAALIGSGGGIAATVATVLLINARHLFYGPAVLDRLPQRLRLPLPVLAFGLTDEVMAAAVARLDRVAAEQREVWLLGLWLGAYLAWAGGTLIGVAAAGEVPADWTWLREAFAFILPALFLSLLLDVGLRTHAWTIAVSAAAAAGLLAVLPGHLALVGAMLLGAGTAALRGRS